MVVTQRTGRFSSRPRSSRSLFSLGGTTLLAVALLGAATTSPKQVVAERTQQGSSGPQAFEERAVRVLEIPLGLDLYMPVPEGNPWKLVFVSIRSSIESSSTSASRRRGKNREKLCLSLALYSLGISES